MAPRRAIHHLTASTNADPILAYYINQSGGSLPFTVFQGSPLQRGYGGIFSSLLKFIRPVFSALKPVAKSVARKILPTVGSQLATTGKNLVSDIISGENVGQSFKKRFNEAGEGLRDTAISAITQSGSGIKRKRVLKRLQFAKRPRRDRSDIFPV